MSKNRNGDIMGNRQNLKLKDNTQSREEAKINGRKGGLASGEKRREIKSLKDAYRSIAVMPHKPIGALALTIVDTYKGNGVITVEKAIMLAQVVKAANGDTSAATYIRDTIGEKEVEKFEHSGITITLSEDLAKWAK